MSAGQSVRDREGIASLKDEVRVLGDRMEAAFTENAPPVVLPEDVQERSARNAFRRTAKLVS